jgi:hypothetical protein
MILILLMVGWLPLIIAEVARSARPDLDAGYRPQAFAMGWMGITVICSFLAAALFVAHLIWFIIRVFNKQS